MVYRLPAIAAAVHHDAIAAIETKLPGQATDHFPEMRDERRIRVLEGRDRLDRLLGNHKHVNRSLRRHVVKCQAVFILENDVSWNFPVDDFLKDSFRGHNSPHSVKRQHRDSNRIVARLRTRLRSSKFTQRNRFIHEQNRNLTDDRV